MLCLSVERNLLHSRIVVRLVVTMMIAELEQLGLVLEWLELQAMPCCLTLTLVLLMVVEGRKELAGRLLSAVEVDKRLILYHLNCTTQLACMELLMITPMQMDWLDCRFDFEQNLNWSLKIYQTYSKKKILRKYILQKLNFICKKFTRAFSAVIVFSRLLEIIG